MPLLAGTAKEQSHEPGAKTLSLPAVIDGDGQFNLAKLPRDWREPTDGYTEAVVKVDCDERLAKMVVDIGQRVQFTRG